MAITIEKNTDNSATANAQARFSLLSNGLIRLEFSRDGQFEDRKSFRAIDRPAPIPFSSITEKDNTLILAGNQFEIRYQPDGKPFHSGNIAAYSIGSDKPFWDPSFIDSENLGSVHTSMDCVKPGLIPHGVHPATVENHLNDSSWNFWSFYWRQQSGGPSGIGNAYEHGTHFDEYFAVTDFDDLPIPLQELLNERSKFPPGLISKAGYFLYNDSNSPVLNPDTNWIEERKAPEGTLDLYLFQYGKNYKAALRDYKLLFGETPLAPRYSFGLWYSRFPTFNQNEIYELIEEFEKHDLPLDMFVFDLEWHKRGWYGFEWDTNHIQTPDKLLDNLRKNNIHTTFNVHPDRVPVDDDKFDQFLEAAGLECDKTKVGKDCYGSCTFGDFDISIPRHAKAFMDTLHKPIQDQGVDFWWIDGSCNIKEIDGLDDGLWTNHIYHQHIKETYPDRRPMIFSRTPGFGAHRYAFHFTGDSWSYWDTLRSQVEQTTKAGHIGQSLITHDIGGHISSFVLLDSELYARWVQFAVLNPVVRLHSSKMAEGIGGERRPWMYCDKTVNSFHKAMELRMALVPYLYTLAWESHTSCLPICRSNCLEMPDWETGYSIWDSYFLGDRIYAAPVVNAGTIRKVTLPPGEWYSAITEKCISSDGLSEITQVSPFAEFPLHYYKAGSLMLKQPYCHRAAVLPETLVLEIYSSSVPCKDHFTLYEDDGLTQAHRDNQFSTQEFRMEQSDTEIVIDIAPVNGHFTGCLTTRNIEFRVIGKASNKAILDGKVITGNTIANLDMKHAHKIIITTE